MKFFANKDELRKKIATLFEEHGVTSYMVAFSDPDSDTSFYATGGSTEWVIGAAELVKNTELKNQIIQDSDED